MNSGCKKIQASSMMYAVFIVFIVTVLTGALFVILQLNRKEITEQQKYIHSIQSVKNGIQLLLSDFYTEEEKKNYFIEQTNDSVSLFNKKWGLFHVIGATSRYKTHEQNKVALVGNYYKNSSDLTLYLTDKNKALSVCGKTSLHGTVSLPDEGVQKVRIEGRHFEGNDVVFGQIKQSSRMFPKPSDEIKKLNESLSSYINRSEMILISGLQNDSIFNSFENPSIVVLAENKTPVTAKINGNIILYSKGELIISKDSQIHDAILFAKEIKFQAQFSGNLQAFALDSLVLEKECKLLYPSVLGVVRTEEDTIAPSLKIGKECELNGLLIGYNKTAGALLNPLIDIDQGATVTGQMYCNRFLQCKGSVIGSVFADEFLLRTASSVYVNHLLDVIIDYDRLSAHYVGFDITGENHKSKIIKWLY